MALNLRKTFSIYIGMMGDRESLQLKAELKKNRLVKEKHMLGTRNHLVANVAPIPAQKKTILSRSFPKQALWALQLSA